jgi:hypothetical protein
VISFTPLLLYFEGESSQYPLDRRLGGPWSWSGQYGEEKNLALLGIEPRSSSSWAIAIPTGLSQLQKFMIMLSFTIYLFSFPYYLPANIQKFYVYVLEFVRKGDIDFLNNFITSCKIYGSITLLQKTDIKVWTGETQINIH